MNPTYIRTNRTRIGVRAVAGALLALSALLLPPAAHAKKRSAHPIPVLQLPSQTLGESDQDQKNRVKNEQDGESQLDQQNGNQGNGNGPKKKDALKRVVASAVSLATATPIAASDKALILYDSPSGGDFNWIGELDAKMVANLLGHFSLAYDLKPVEQYATTSALRIDNYRATFYLGGSYDNPLPQAFLDDVMKTEKPVIWFHYNLWELAWSPDSQAATLGFYNPFFESRFGFRFNELDTTMRTQVQYKNQLLTKDPLDMELGWTVPQNAALTQVPAWSCPDTTKAGAISSACIPYIIHGRNLWYVADSPFSYIAEEDRYLAFCDLLYDMLGVPFPVEKHRALVRLEDVDPTYDTTQLKKAVDYLAGQGIPFSIAVIPHYLDPKGFYNDGIKEDVTMTQQKAFVTALKYAVSKGGTLVMHGNTHQYSNVKNWYSGVSGDDYEFFRVTVDANINVVEDHPIKEDTLAWVTNRIQAAQTEFDKNGLTTFTFEAPHYAMSELDYKYVATKFPLTYHRAQYFGSGANSAFYAGQFFPYVIQKDIYGQKIVPENLNDIEPEPFLIFPTRFPADLIREAKKNLVVRDGWASFFFHPFYSLDYLKQTVQGIKQLGYTFVPISKDMQ